jgi:hypothetical protein
MWEGVKRWLIAGVYLTIGTASTIVADVPQAPSYPQCWVRALVEKKPLVIVIHTNGCGGCRQLLNELERAKPTGYILYPAAYETDDVAKQLYKRSPGGVPQIWIFWQERQQWKNATLTGYRPPNKLAAEIRALMRGSDTAVPSTR